MTTDDVVRKLAEWCNELNQWRWPADFPVPKPEGFDALPARDRAAATDRYRALGPYIDALHTITPSRAVMRDWHVRVLGRTAAQFAAWWAAEFPAD